MSEGQPIVVALNGTAIPRDACAIDICDLAYGQITYVPSQGINLAYLIVFAVFIVVQLGQGIFYRTWSYAFGMVLGLILEVIGYVARLGLNDNPFSFDWFVMYLVCLTIGPAFLSAAIYLCLSRIVVVYGEDIARFRPSTYTITFICCDFISLVLQAVGGAIAASADTPDESDDGVHIMVAGLAFQVFSLMLYIAVAIDFFLAVRRSSETQRNQRFHEVRTNKLFKLLIAGLSVALVAIFVRCVFRVAELSGGFNSELANDELTFNILEGPMIIIASLALTVAHPGLCFQRTWHAATWTWKKNSQSADCEKGESGYEGSEKGAEDH